MKIYTVVVTDFTDDYKCRCGDWSSNRRLRAFATRERAEAHVANILVDEIHERNEGKEPDDHFYVPDNASFDDIVRYAEKYLQGEYVRMRITWDIEEVEVEGLPSDDDDDDEEANATKKRKQ